MANDGSTYSVATNTSYTYVTDSSKTVYIYPQSEIYYIIPAYISLPPLTNVNWSAIPESFLLTYFSSKIHD